MRDRTKLVLTLAGLTLTSAAVREAAAGNLAGDITNAAYRNYVEYYSVNLTFGQFLDYNGPVLPEGSCWTVDDVTYAMDLDPEYPSYWASPMFDVDTLYVPEPAVDLYFNYNLVTTLFYKIGWGSLTNPQKYLIRWARARGTGFNAFLLNGPPLSPAPAFDSISHTAWGEVIGREKVVLEGFNPYASSTTTHSTWAVEASESRHYQTPEIVRMPNGVSFMNEGRALVLGGLSQYKFGRVHLKGRIFIADPSGAVTPVLDGNHHMRISPP